MNIVQVVLNKGEKLSHNFGMKLENFGLVWEENYLKNILKLLIISWEIRKQIVVSMWLGRHLET